MFTNRVNVVSHHVLVRVRISRPTPGCRSGRASHSREPAVRKTGAGRAPVRTSDLRAVRTLNARPPIYVDAGSCAQSREWQSVADMVVGEKNRCLLVGPLDARSPGVPRWALRAGRDNFRDNLAVRSVPVTQSVSFT